MVRRRVANAGQWRPLVGLVLDFVSEKRSRVLTLTVQAFPGLFLGTAVEAPATARSIEEVFHDHAHDVIAQDASLAFVIAKAEAYGRAWLRRQDRLAACPCPPISHRRRGAGPRKSRPSKKR